MNFVTLLREQPDIVRNYHSIGCNLLSRKGTVEQIVVSKGAEATALNRFYKALQTAHGTGPQSIPITGRPLKICKFFLGLLIIGLLIGSMLRH